MFKFHSKFVADESGAVTIDYLPIAAAVAFLGVVMAVQVGTGSTRLGGNVSDATGSVDVVELLNRESADTVYDPSGPMYQDDFTSLPPYLSASGFVPRRKGNPCGTSCSGLGDGTNPGNGSHNNNAGNSAGGTGSSNPGADVPTYDDPDEEYAGGGGGWNSPEPEAPTTPTPVAMTFDYVFPDLIIDHNGWSTTAVSNWLDLGAILGQERPFTITGPGNPTAQAMNGTQQSSGTMRWGTNIRMDVPLAGESYTAVLNIDNGFYLAAFTVRRLHDPNALPGPNNGGNAPDIPATPDFVIPKTVIGPHYTGHVFSNWMGANNLPFALPTNFEMSGEGNATLQTANGHATSGQIPSWGTQFRADPPPCGMTNTAVITLANGQVGIWQVERPNC